MTFIGVLQAPPIGIFLFYFHDFDDSVRGKKSAILNLQTEKFDNLSYLPKIKQQVRGSEIRMPNFRDPKASKVTSYLSLETSRRIMNVSSGGENMSIP